MQHILYQSRFAKEIKIPHNLVSIFVFEDDVDTSRYDVGVGLAVAITIIRWMVTPVISNLFIREK
jgi:hypothetical protein